MSQVVEEQVQINQNASATINLYLRFLFSHLEIHFTDSVVSIKREFIDEMSAAAIPKKYIMEYRNRLMKFPAEPLETIMPENVTHQIFQLSYDSICEELGPIQTDHVVTQMITRIGSTRVAKNYSFKHMLQ